MLFNVNLIIIIIVYYYIYMLGLSAFVDKITVL
jgi:hypothetical protein